MSERMYAGRLVRIEVFAVIPDGVSDSRFRAYVEDAVANMKGAMDPNDPLFDLNGEKVLAAKPIRTNYTAYRNRWFDVHSTRQS